MDLMEEVPRTPEKERSGQQQQQQQQQRLQPPPLMSPPPILSSLPYCGDLDAARRARDSPAVRLLTQLRDRDAQLTKPSSLSFSRSSSLGLGLSTSSISTSNSNSPSTTTSSSNESSPLPLSLKMPAPPPGAGGGEAPTPAASRFSSLTRRLMEMSFPETVSNNNNNNKNEKDSGSSEGPGGHRHRQTHIHTHTVVAQGTSTSSTSTSSLSVVEGEAGEWFSQAAAQGQPAHTHTHVHPTAMKASSSSRSTSTSTKDLGGGGGGGGTHTHTNCGQGQGGQEHGGRLARMMPTGAGDTGSPGFHHYQQASAHTHTHTQTQFFHQQQQQEEEILSVVGTGAACQQHLHASAGEEANASFARRRIPDGGAAGAGVHHHHSHTHTHTHQEDEMFLQMKCPAGHHHPDAAHTHTTHLLQPPHTHSHPHPHTHTHPLIQEEEDDHHHHHHHKQPLDTHTYTHTHTSERQEEEIEDPILLTRIPFSESFLVDCPCAHRFGTETLYGCIKTALSDDLIPACPLANHPDHTQRCNYLLTQQEVEQVLNKYSPPSQLPANERKLWRFRRGRLIDGRLGWVSERVTEAFLRKGKIGAGCMECPNGRCGYWVEPTRPLEKQRVDCPKCLMAHCSLCKRPYHYRCSCDEVMTITKQWLEWQQHGREPYLQKMAAEDSSYQAALDVFTSRRSAHVQEVKTAEQNWGLLVADENYKASRCRRCPHCHRVIERIDGCDTMVCGQNAHGGNIQNGCGQGFNWNEALFYNADIGTKRSIQPFAEVPPPQISRVKHQIMDGTPIVCDICQAKIQGPLAMCINCPTFNCCIRCQNKHTRGHVLRLYMDDSYSGRETKKSR